MGTPVSSSNKTYLPDITEIMVKVQLNTIAIALLNISHLMIIYACLSLDVRKI